MSSWLAPIKKILDAETGDLRELAKLAGGRPEIFYVGRDLSRCNLRGQNLSGMDLTGTLLNPELMDDETVIDPEFDPRFKIQSDYVQIGMREEVLALVFAFADEVNYVYKAWALKALLETGLRYINNKEVKHVIASNDTLSDLIDERKGRMRRVTVQVYPFIQEGVHRLETSEGRKPNRDSYNKILVAALVRQYIARSKAKNYAAINSMEMFDGAGKYLNDIRRGKRFMR